MSRKKGNYYEDQAVFFLTQRDWTVLTRNYVAHHGEIDIIATKDDELAFVEVKGRKRKSSWNDVLITPKKQKILLRTADAFLQTSEEHFMNIVFHVIVIEGDSVTMIENAFDGE